MSGSLAWAAAVGDSLVDGGVDVAAHLPDSRLQGVLARLAERGVAGVLTWARRAGRTAAVALEPELGGGRGAH
ncbi:hypothetical protein ACL02T_01210 [Pseudonocardia sp. RS010]|uniref:hypothetical protein n=1 Tax=Pseudonocardia sp. RS010 TaxID=3385979 RepID=UPI00399F3164